MMIGSQRSPNVVVKAPGYISITTLFRSSFFVCFDFASEEAHDECE